LKIEIRTEPYDPWKEVKWYQQSALAPGSFGACATFVGTMRNFNGGDHVSEMKLEHYQGMTESQLSHLANDTKSQYALLDILILHRIGKITPGDPIVLVAAWSACRAAAFDACRDMMEALKSKVTFWKKETLPDHERWIE